MSATRTRSTRTLTIDLREDLACELDVIAKQESRDISSLLEEGLRRLIFDRISRDLQLDRAEAIAHCGDGYTEADVERLVHEVRAEIASEERARSKQTA